MCFHGLRSLVRFASIFQSHFFLQVDSGVSPDRRHSADRCIPPVPDTTDRFISFNVSGDHPQAGAPVVLVARTDPWTGLPPRFDLARCRNANSGCIHGGEAYVAVGRRVGANEDAHSIQVADAGGEPAPARCAGGRKARDRGSLVIVIVRRSTIACSALLAIDALPHRSLSASSSHSLTRHATTDTITLTPHQPYTRPRA